MPVVWVAFIEVLIGRRRGGMGASMIIASGVFGAIVRHLYRCGCVHRQDYGIAAGERGYPRGYSSAMLGISALLGILIPPSIIMILFAVVTRQSVAALFAASIGPALLLIFVLIVLNRISPGSGSRKF